VPVRARFPVPLSMRICGFPACGLRSSSRQMHAFLCRTPLPFSDKPGLLPGALVAAPDRPPPVRLDRLSAHRTGNANGCTRSRSHECGSSP
jgi:hypothetical protein